MDLRDTPDEAAFRQEVRDFIAQNLPDSSKARGARRFEDADREWSREARRGRLRGPDLAEGVRRRGRAVQPPGDLPRGARARRGAVAPRRDRARHGRPDDHRLGHRGAEAALPRRRSSAPRRSGARASRSRTRAATSPRLRTRIEDKGDHFLVNGQKVWSSFAHIADFCILVGQGQPDAPKYKNLTYVIVDMHAPGVEVRPLVQITGHPEFNEIFFTDVKVPKENILGGIGDGWQVAMTTLLHERGTLGFALSATLDVAVRKLIALAKERNVTDPVLRDRIAREWIELQALKYTNYRSLTTLQKTGIPGPEGSASKLVWSENNQRLTKLALEILGSHAQLTNGGGYADGYWQYQQLRSRGNTIEAGTSEILRNIVAERVLGMPRSR